MSPVIYHRKLKALSLRTVISGAYPLSMTDIGTRVGFNTLRKHIKVEAEEFYYLCDKLGMIVFQDMVNNGEYSFFRDTALPTAGLQKLSDKKMHRDPETRKAFREGMAATVRQLKNHPCICYWTIFNEGWGQFDSDRIYEEMKALDSSRFIDSTSGWFRSKKSDVESLHIYFGSWKKLKAGEKPLVLSEFGGYCYGVQEHLFNPEKAYGYKACKSLENLNRDLQVLYEEKMCDGEVVAVDTVRYAIFSRGGQDLPSIMFDQKDGGNIYWNEKGESMRKAFLKAPLKFSRISSGFSYARRHPVTRKVQPHTGVDYAAPKGTPVMTIGDGVITSMKYEGAGGNIVRIRHNSVYSTAYLHLSRYAKGLKAGQRVRQGEVIGYVGSTGRSTGPHLHFETRYKGFAFDPQWLIDFKEGKLRHRLFVLKKKYFNIYSNYEQDFEDEILNDEEDKKEDAEREAMRWYTIKSGDTLGRIAINNNTTVSELCRLNGITRNTTLKIGKKIRVR